MVGFRLLTLNHLQYKYGCKQKAAQQSVHPTSGILRDLQVFSPFGFILASSRVHARPLAGNASRWADYRLKIEKNNK